MDDWIALSLAHWELRRAIAAVNRTLAAMQLDKHPDKTAICLGLRWALRTTAEPRPALIFWATLFAWWMGKGRPNPTRYRSA